MKIVITDRGGKLTAQEKARFEQKLAKLQRIYERIFDARLELIAENAKDGEKAKIAKITVQIDAGRVKTVHAEERGIDFKSAFDLAIDKVDRQIRKIKEKTTSHQRISLEEKLASVIVEEELNITVRRVPVYVDTVENAAKLLDENGMPFHIFTNAKTGDLAIIYHNPAGGYTLVEPYQA